MKSDKLIKTAAVLLILLMALPALATQVKWLVFSSAGGRSQSTARQFNLTVGQSVAGKADHVAGNYAGALGIWEVIGPNLIVSAVGEDLPPISTQLFRNYPNPFNPSTRISFSLKEASHVKIDVYDLRGRLVETLLDGARPAGNHFINYEPRTLASGVYLVLMQTDSFRASQRMVLVK